MNYPQLAVVAVVCVLALTGCELKLQWHDATDQHRGDTELQSDARDCMKETGVDPNVGIAPDHKAAWESCMHGKGWAPNGKNSEP